MTATNRSDRVRIGIDLDNTVVCYDRVFHRLAVQRGWIPVDTPATKLAVRAYLRDCGREEAWTELQGEAYGPGMESATAFADCIDLLQAWLAAGIDLVIVSHRTRVPHLGPPHDLHGAARRWLERSGLVANTGTAVRPGCVHLETTRAAKCDRIAELGCSHFIDDLPELFAERGFPRNTLGILFDPNSAHPQSMAALRARSWAEIGHHLRDTGVAV